MRFRDATSVHYAMNLPTNVVITGCDSLKIPQQALNAMRSFHPMGDEEVAALLAKTAKAAQAGAFEMCKPATTSTAPARTRSGSDRKTQNSDRCACVLKGHIVRPRGAANTAFTVWFIESVSRRSSRISSRCGQLRDLSESFVLFVGEVHRGRGNVLLKMFDRTGSRNGQQEGGSAQ